MNPFHYDLYDINLLNCGGWQVIEWVFYHKSNQRTVNPQKNVGFYYTTIECSSVEIQLGWPEIIVKLKT